MNERYLKYQITPEEKRNEILEEFLTGNLTYRELAEKYQVREATIRQWVHMYIRKKKEVSLPPDSKPEVKMSRKKKASTESAEIKALKARISELELQNLALNTLIDVAGRNGLEIRKKSGAKQ